MYWRQGVELLLKVWKSRAKVDKTEGRTRERVLVELYAKRLGQVVSNWVLWTCAGSPLRWSWYKGAGLLHGQWLLLFMGLGELPMLVVVLRLQSPLKWCKKRARRPRPFASRGRHVQPLAFQSVLDPLDPDHADGGCFGS